MRSPLRIGRGAEELRRGHGPGEPPRSRASRFFSRAAEIAASLRARLAASVWSATLARALLTACVLGVLAWIGRTASAGPPVAEGARADASAATAPQPSSPAPPVTDAGAEPQRATSARATPEDPVTLNTAGLDELRRLPGVGPKRGAAILALRQRLGRFRRLEELLRVKGVGRATLRKWRPLVRLDPPGDAGAPS